MSLVECISFHWFIQLDVMLFVAELGRLFPQADDTWGSLFKTMLLGHFPIEGGNTFLSGLVVSHVSLLVTCWWKHCQKLPCVSSASLSVVFILPCGQNDCLPDYDSTHSPSTVMLRVKCGVELGLGNHIVASTWRVIIWHAGSRDLAKQVSGQWLSEESPAQVPAVTELTNKRNNTLCKKIYDNMH